MSNKYLAILFFANMILGPTGHAYPCSQMYQGSYQLTCNDCISSDPLVASCRREDGTWNQNATLDHSYSCWAAGNDIANIDGNLECIKSSTDSSGT